jgi:holliday junction DNA helicase RuvA
MYQYLAGKLVEKTATMIVVDVNGVGYELPIPVSTFGALPEIGQNIRILTHYVVREDFQALYGFYTEEERQLFRMLLSISGIGPKSALTVLSGITIQEFKRAIVDGDVVTLTSIPGIGRKTAERLVIELREKILVGDRKQTGSAVDALHGQSDLMEDSLRALVELGYKKQAAQAAIQKAVKQLDKAKLTVPELVRTSLKFV